MDITLLNIIYFSKTIKRSLCNIVQYLPVEALRYPRWLWRNRDHDISAKDRNFIFNVLNNVNDSETGVSTITFAILFYTTVAPMTTVLHNRRWVVLLNWAQV